VQVVFGVHIPDVVVVPGHSTPWRAFSDAYFARSSMAVWKASRGFGGKSFLLALLGLVEAVTLKANVKILGGSGAQSRNVQDYVSTVFYNKPNVHKEWWDGEPQTTLSKFSWGNTIQSLTASSRSVRGPHPQRLRLDEVDEMPLHIFEAAMGQAMAKVEDRKIIIPSQTVCSSTHQYSNGTMTAVLRMANERGWPVHEWSYAETSAEGGWLLPEQVEEKKNDISNIMWDVEYSLQEPSAEGRAIIPECVHTMFDDVLGSYAGYIGQYVEIEEPGEPGEGMRYCTGADWGKKQDFTVIMTYRIDMHPYRMVAFERRRREPWPRMVGRYDNRIKRFPGKAYHDVTGLGSVIDDYKTSRGFGVFMEGSQRKALFSNYIAAIEDGGIVAPNIEWVRKEHLYVEVNDLYGSGHAPDSVVCGALTYAASTGGSGGRGT